MRLVAFCEAPADFAITRDLVDRVLREHAPGWVAEQLDDTPDAVRTWVEDAEDREFFDLHHYDAYVRSLGVRVPHGSFDGRRSPGDLMALTIFHVVRRLGQLGEPIDAVLLVWDMDKQPKGRARGLVAARNQAASWASFAIVLGCPNAMREAWVLAGFEPEDDDEHERLQALRRELGFAPHEHSARLDAASEQAKLSAKRVLAALTGDDRERERRCWAETPLDTLARRGDANGLRQFLDEVKARIVPLCQGRR